MCDTTRSQPPTLLDAVRKVLPLYHSSIHIEGPYVQSRGLCSRPDGGQTWPRQTLLVNSRRSISSVMEVSFSRGMYLVSLTSKRRL
jgi:hypothetical protein